MVLFRSNGYLCMLNCVCVFFVATLRGMYDLSSLTRGRTCAPLQWRRGVLTTVPAGKSLNYTFPFTVFTPHQTLSSVCLINLLSSTYLRVIST